MNRIKVLTLAMLAGAVMFSSCKKDDETDDPIITPSGPTLTLTPESITSWTGESQTIEYTITTPSANHIVSLDITTDETELVEVFLTDDDLDDNVANGAFTFIMPAGPTGNMWADGDFFTITFKAVHEVDNVEYTTTKNVTVTYDALSLFTPFDVEVTTGVLNNLIGPNPGAWDLMNDVALSTGDAAADKDMVNITDGSGLDDFDLGWTAANTTTYVQFNAYDYDNATKETAQAVFMNGTPMTTVENVAAGDVYVANLRGTNEFAVIQIVDIIQSAGDNEDYISFKYKK